jgi:hypothetical protein
MFALAEKALGEETTISVRGVDSDLWVEFQESVSKKYGTVYGNLGPEVTSALKAWLEIPRPNIRSADVSKYLSKPNVPRVLDPQGSMSVRGLIYESMKKLGGEATVHDVISFIHEKYGQVNSNTIATAMSDLAVNGPPSSLYSLEARFLERVSRGRYRLTKEVD